MNRRGFVAGLAGTAGLGWASSAGFGAGAAPSKRTVRAADIHDHLMKLGPWVKPEDTVDTFKAGDPNTVITKMAVAWMCYTWAIRKALEAGCNLFVCHEPTYYDHRDQNPSVFEFDSARKKRELIESSKLVILRCHDVWDRVEGVGIPFAWAEFLGLERRVDSSTFCHVYEIDEAQAKDVAAMVAGKVSALGQRAVSLVGPADKKVRRIAIGTGAITPFREMVGKLKADLTICTDDGFLLWRDGGMAIDMEFPVVLVNHACSEEAGIRKLAEHLAKAFPDIPVMPIAETCMFTSITA